MMMILAESSNVLSDVMNTFGVTWPKFLAQIILFIIVFLILRKFAFGPITAMLAERSQRIEKGEENLRRIEIQMAEAKERSEAIFGEANSEADKMIQEAQESAEALGDKKRQEAVTEANQITEKARESATLERERLLSELKQDFGRLVVETTGKVTGKVLTAEDQKRLNEETASQISV